MASCPNKNHPDWEKLVLAVGENKAYFLWDQYNSEVPETYFEGVNYTLKSIEILNSDKAIEVFEKGRKNGWDLNKTLTELQIPKEQKQIILDKNITNREELITSLLADNSFVVEVNTTKNKYTDNKKITPLEPLPDDFIIFDNTEEEFINAGIKYKVEYSDGKPTQYYSNLTVPGGTNYTENEISTPDITPNIKGHAQFSTDNGIGWFRSDEQAITSKTQTEKDNIRIGQLKEMGYSEQEISEMTEQDTGSQGKIVGSTKTRRILEVQSDLFQKGRDKDNLTGIPYEKENVINTSIQEKRLSEMEKGVLPNMFSIYTNFNNSLSRKEVVGHINNKLVIWKNPEYNDLISKYVNGETTNQHGVEFWILNDEISEQLKQEYKDNLKSIISNKPQAIQKEKERVRKINESIKIKNEKTKNENQFLQLLNKKNNWVTFFVKSIIQDSAKKGYEKVLFPKGDTAAKIEGHQTLEEFKKQKEARIYELETKFSQGHYDYLLEKEKNNTLDGEINKAKKGDFNPFTGDTYTEDQIVGYSGEFAELNNLRTTKKEIDTLKQELADVESGQTQLSSIANFYETIITNILNKNGYSPIEIVDEFGNTWNEVSINHIAAEPILLQQSTTKSSKANADTISKVKKAAEAMGISIVDLQSYLKGNPNIDANNINALADTLRGVIAISQGNEGVALTEEMVHIATAILEQTNPSLIQEMISKIGKFKIYKQTLEEYKNNPAYQLENGKPNIRKIKKEAVDKLIAEVIINQNEGSTEYPELLEEANRSLWRNFWQKILSWFNSSYNKSGIEIFKEAAEIILNENVGGTVENLSGKEDVFFQLSDIQRNIQQRLADTKNVVKKREAAENENANDPLFLDTEKVNNWYEYVNPDGTVERITKRVTDRVKMWYRQKFGDKDFSSKQKEMNEFKRDQGTKYHLYFEEIHARYFNTDGTRKTTLEPRPYIKDQKDRNIYNKLEKYFVELVDSFSQEGQEPLVFSEAIVYDPKAKEAGTIDLLIVEPDGKTNIFDWKFMSVASGAKDVAWFKQGAYNIQLRTYKNILQKYYGVDKMGKNRAIPILFDIRNKKTGLGINKVVTPFINDIAIGSVDTSKIESLKLLPVSEESESTEIPEIDTLLKKLNAVHSKISGVRVVSDEQKEFKKQRLNIIKEAVRLIQGTLNVEPLVDVISIMKKEGENILNDYEHLYKHAGAREKKFTDKQLSEFAETLQDYLAIGETFGNIGDEITKIFYEPGSEKLAVTEKQRKEILKRKELSDKIQNESTEIRLNTEKIKTISGEFADKFIGQRNLVNGLLDIAKEIKSIGSIFRGVSELSLPATDVLFKVVTNSKAKASRDAYVHVQKLMEIRKRIVDRGGNTRSLLSKIYQKDKDGNKRNKLIQKYDRRFYKAVDDLAQNPDRSVKQLKAWIDLDSYKKEASEMLKKRIKHIKRSYTDSALIERLIEEEIRKYDINDINFNGFSNYIIKKHPREEWISEEYKEIQKDKDLFDLYNFIAETNARANEIGYIENKVKNTFLPFIRKGFAESLAWDFSLSAVKRLTEDLTIRPDDVGYGAVDELTKEIVNTIPRYYTYDFTQTEEGTDMSDVSEDLFKNLSLYVTHLERYKYLSDVEGQLTLVKKIESFKDSYKSSIIGNVVPDPKRGGEPTIQANNDVNTKLYTNFLNAMLYDQKYPISTNDIPLATGKFGKYVASMFKMVTGKEINLDDNTSVTSLMKLIDAGNRYFQLKTLGFSFLSGAANLFGTTIQMNTQAGVYYKSREYGKNAIKLIGNKFSTSDEREMFIQLIDTFMPLKDDPNYEKIKKAGLTKLTQESFSDILMVFMREPEFHVEKSIFLTLLQNTMVDENGKLVNIREYVKAKYPNRYKSSSDYRVLNKRIEQEIEQLKNTKSIDKTKTLVDGKLHIPGLDLNDKNEIQRLTNLTRRLSRNATGSLSDSDINLISMNIFGKSAMVFKGWIPKLVDTRFGEFRKVSDDFTVEIGEDGLTTGEKYDIGRIRLLGYVLGTNIRDRAFNITNILKFNDKGALALDRMYEDFAANYMKRTGKDLVFDPETGEYKNFISKNDFIDLIRTNLRNQIKELGILLTFVAITVAVPPPDEDMSRSEKNFYRFTEKTINRFVSELSFFYNPAEFNKLLSGNMFPVLGIASDITKFSNHMFMETTGLDLYNPDLTRKEVFKKAQPIKYGAKMVPFAKELLNYLALFDDDFAKEFDIYINNRNR